MQDNTLAIAGYWLHAAEVDLEVAREVRTRFPQVSCFHAQQAMEKGFKALLVVRVGDAPRSHVVTELFDELTAIGVSPSLEVQEAAAALHRHYLPSRYPDALGGGDPSRLYSVRDADQSILQASLCLEWSKQHFNLQ